MQQKAQFIATVIHQPKLLILDEPFSGLDPVNAELIKNEIYQLHQQGTTIIFSTHRMEQVEEICNTIALINKGKLILNGDVAEIKQKHKEHLYKVAFNNLPVIDENQLFEVVNTSENTIELKLKQPQSNNELLHYFISKGNTITAYYEILPTLNNIFINLAS